jgi:UDPglucose 6-dehydrogenase
MAFTRLYGYEAKLAKVTDEVNQLQIKNLVDIVSTCTKGNRQTISILGLAYKPNTPVIEESPSIRLIEELIDRELEVIVYDPLSMANTRAHFGDNIFYASSVEDCFKNSSMCIIAIQAEEFKKIDESYIVNEPTIIIDCWRMLDPSRLGSKVRYIGLGRNEG